MVLFTGWQRWSTISHGRHQSASLHIRVQQRWQWQMGKNRIDQCNRPRPWHCICPKCGPQLPHTGHRLQRPLYLQYKTSRRVSVFSVHFRYFNLPNSCIEYKGRKKIKQMHSSMNARIVCGVFLWVWVYMHSALHTHHSIIPKHKHELWIYNANNHVPHSTHMECIINACIYTYYYWVCMYGMLVFFFFNSNRTNKHIIIIWHTFWNILYIVFFY